MRNRTALLAAVSLLAALAGAAAQESFLHHTLTASLVVADPEAAAERIAAWVEQQGGYFVIRSDSLVVARVPNAALKPLRELLGQLADRVVDVSPGATDLREQMLAAQAALSSREEVLARNLAYLDRADVSGTLAIEGEVATLMKEIEGLKGRMRKLETDRTFARAEIKLGFLEQSVPERLPSSFAWINGVDFYAFVKGAFR